eukprot:TRINITY_DN109149_c0_g1_i1.p1 TRINITY_DN109149_c0_g1~~TRINITY_DN109149_c0_g1_i1.p1  ORF type:complete len:395 (+),score=83.92 TRINITY_DN109149_c0_g1_i1:70-1254(+)
MASSAPDVDLKSRGMSTNVVVVVVAIAVGLFFFRGGDEEATGDDGEAGLAAGAISWLLWLMLRLAQLTAAVFLMLLAVLVAKQRSMLYVPVPPGTQRSPKDNPSQFRSPEAWRLPWEDVTITTEDGTRLSAWLTYRDSVSSDADAPYTFLYFHGNAGNIGHRLENIRDMHKKLGVNILILDYRGYGDSEDGSGPTEAGFHQDAMAAFEWLIKRSKQPRKEGQPCISADRIIFFGRSIGGAVAVKLAADLLKRRKEKASELPLPAGLVLENTFTSLRDMALQIFPFLSPLWPLLRSPLIFDEWRSADSLRYFASNWDEWCCCLMSGLQDQIVPPAQMVEIHDILKQHRPNVLKCFRFTHGGHNDTPQRGGDAYWESFNKYMHEVKEFEAKRNAEQ